MFTSYCYLAALLIAYLLGSIPFGFLLTKYASGQDIRQMGSGNIGTTNVLRSGGKKLAFLTLAGDLLKGSLAVIISQKLAAIALAHGALSSAALSTPAIAAEHQLLIVKSGLMAGLCAFLGHLYPIWLRFKGGKGVATYIGILLASLWPLCVIFLAIWLIAAYFSKYSSLSALLAALTVPIVAQIEYGFDISFYLTLMSIMIFIKHKQNIQRLWQGREAKIGQNKNDGIS